MTASLHLGVIVTAGTVGYASPYIADADDDRLPDPRGCVLLVEVFWKQVHDDLSSTMNPKCHSTVRWVDGADGTDGFTAWCELSGANPSDVRAALEQRHARAFLCYRR